MSLSKGTISGKHVKTIMPILIDENKSVKEIIKSENIVIISDPVFLKNEIIKIINSNPQVANQYSERPERVVKFILGMLMKNTKGQSNPVIASEICTFVLEAQYG
jgi:aspartyl-tRNA(Asn)/glutamyl-tRNA(Gln) amidotransferase subunit B